MKMILDLFRRNWGLKLLALVLALVIFYSMRENSDESRVPRNPFLKGTSNNG
jgi:hypothetical protein